MDAISATSADPFAPPVSISPIDPCGHCRVTVHARAGEHPLLLAPAATSWTEAPGLTTAVIDLSAVALCNSALMGWLLRVAAQVRPVPALVIGAAPIVVRQLHAAGLDRLLTIC